jgi:hypothetical protein
MLRRVAPVRTDVLEICIASIIRVTRIGELGTTVSAAPFSFSKILFYIVLHVLVFLVLHSFLNFFPYEFPFSPIEKKAPWLSVRKQTIPTDWPPRPAKQCRLLPVEGVAWSAQRILTAFNPCFLDRSRYLFIQVAPQLSARGWMDPIPEPLLPRKSGRAGNRTPNL